MKYEGVQCPVCLKAFDADSDVVVCPECGTPHHRECYDKTGDCINAVKHGTEFAWVNPLVPPVVAETKKEKPQVAENPSVIAIGSLNKENMPKNGVIGEMSPDQMGPTYREIKGDEKIGNYTVDEYASVIQKNIPKFMPRFMMFERTGRKVSWNWAAFFFGPFWLAYRKMYKYALLGLLLTFFIPLVFYSSVTEYYQESFNLYGEALTSEAYQSTAEMNDALDTLQANMPEQPVAITASSYIEMAVDILCALFGNYLYMQKCTGVLDKAKAMEDAEKKKAFLEKKGGRSVLSIILVIVAFYAFMIAIGVIVNLAGTDLATFLQKFIK